MEIMSARYKSRSVFMLAVCEDMRGTIGSEVMEQFSFLLGSDPRTNAFLGFAYKTRHFEKDFIVDVHDWKYERPR